MIFIKFFWKGFVWLFQIYICTYKWRNKLCECYSCLKMIVQAHLHVEFFPIFCIKSASLKRFYLYVKPCNQAQFLSKKIIMECLGITIFAWTILQIYNCHSMHSHLSWNAFFCIIFPWNNTGKKKNWTKQWGKTYWKLW